MEEQDGTKMKITTVVETAEVHRVEMQAAAEDLSDVAEARPQGAVVPVGGDLVRCLVNKLEELQEWVV